MLDKDDSEIANIFGGETGEKVDKFAQVTWHSGPRGIPLLDACQRWFAGSVLQQLDFGDHVGPRGPAGLPRLSIGQA